MITGKDENRLQFAKKAVNNFKSQLHEHKSLIIINHGKQKVCENAERNITEIMTKKDPSVTLGDLRNQALNMLYDRDYWTTWDDDDYRAPSYLCLLVQNITSPFDVVAISNRLEYNINTKFAWACKKKDGFVLFLSPKVNSIRYLKKDSMEDIDILRQYRNAGYTVRVIDNEPSSYLRLVHQNNTSLFVSQSKNSLVKSNNYIERNVTEDEQSYINAVLQNYYKMRI
jgi:hypothetical protein